MSREQRIGRSQDEGVFVGGLSNVTVSAPEEKPTPPVRFPEHATVMPTVSSDLTEPQQRLVVDQVLLVLEELYPHLALKVASHGANPLPRLRRLRTRISQLSARAFHNEMLSIFLELRDRHTRYWLPESYGTFVADLGFRLEEFFDEGGRGYLVTAVAFSHESFRPGVVVTHWNGIPIDRAVELNGERQSGSNEFARRVQGLTYLTMRPLRIFLPPDEEWVDIRFLSSSGEESSLRLQWFPTSLAPDAGGPSPAGAHDLALGADLVLDIVQKANRQRYARKNAELRADPNFRSVEALPEPLALQDSAIGPQMQFADVVTPSGTFGYIRIWNFFTQSPMWSEPEQFLEAFLQILETVSQEGLILDIRSNPGGYIAAGEILLQTLTPRTITPQRFHFLNSSLVADTCRENPVGGDFLRWLPSLARAAETGAMHSQGFCIESTDADFNRVGQRYHGPVVLLVDALSYSTSDIVAAGFRDHDIGPILGTSGNMGAGGANSWDYELLRLLNPSFRIDSRLEEDFDNGEATPALRQAFIAQGVGLSDTVTISGRLPFPKGGMGWIVTDTGFGRRFEAALFSWMNDRINVFHDDGDRSRILPLPLGMMRMGLSARMCTRVGSRDAGMPLEDLGLSPDEIHLPTRRDVLGQNQDLLERAGSLLSKLPVRTLKGELEPTKRVLRLTVRGLDRVDLHLDGRPGATLNVGDGTVEVALDSAEFSAVELRGYQSGELVALRRLA